MRLEVSVPSLYDAWPAVAGRVGRPLLRSIPYRPQAGNASLEKVV